MKHRIQFKTPDVLHHALGHLPEEEREEAERVAKLFIRWGECLTVEIDTEKEICTVEHV